MAERFTRTCLQHQKSMILLAPLLLFLTSLAIAQDAAGPPPKVKDVTTPATQPSTKISSTLYSDVTNRPWPQQNSNNYDTVDGNGKHAGEGAENDFVWKDANETNVKILTGEKITFCRGFTLERFLNTLKLPAVNAESVKSQELLTLKHAWLGDESSLPAENKGMLAVGALNNFNHSDVFTGEVIRLDDVDGQSRIAPGDIMVLRRSDTTRHCVIFLNWLIEKASGNVVGLIYYSSQAFDTGWIITKNEMTSNGGPVSPTKPTSNNNIGSGAGPRAEFFTNVQYQSAQGDTAQGEYVAEQSYCFHFK